MRDRNFPLTRNVLALVQYLGKEMKKNYFWLIVLIKTNKSAYYSFTNFLLFLNISMFKFKKKVFFAL